MVFKINIFNNLFYFEKKNQNLMLPFKFLENLKSTAKSKTKNQKQKSKN